MDNKEGTFISIGCLALSSLYYIYKQFSQDKKNYKNKLQKINETLKELKQIKDSNQTIDYKSIQKNQQKKMVFFPDVNNYELEKSTFIRIQRQKQNFPKEVELKSPDYFWQNQTGGKFKFKNNGVEITVDIKDCNIHSTILKQNKSNNIIFPQNNHKKALYSSITTVIQAMQHMALYGVLSYSLDEKKFILEPFFITKSQKTVEDTIEQLKSFWDQKIYKITFKKIAIGCLMFAFSYLLIYKPIQNKWRRSKAKDVGVSSGQFEYFKEKVNFYAKNESALNCEFCKTNTVRYVYECGHLVACQQCYLADQKNHKCLICGRKSKKFMKIFI